MPSTEHRAHRRAIAGTAVRVWSWDRPTSADAVEISAGGVFLRTTEVLCEGAHVTVRLDLPGLPSMTVLGRVVRTVKGGLLRAAGMGVRFLDLMPSQQAALEAFVDGRRGVLGGVS